MKLWKWQKGRQQTEYFKFPLWYFKIWKFGFDAYLLKYKRFSLLPIHTDSIENGKHWRLNIKIKGDSKFLIGGKSYYNNLFHLFRADLKPHSLVTFKKETIKLSLGFVKFN